MKNLYSVVLIAIVGAGIVSCEKEIHVEQMEELENATILIRPLEQQDRVGEEEEEEIIQGLLEDSNQTPIVGADVSLLSSADSTAVDSDITSGTGNFEVSAIAGEYLFKIVDGTNAPVYTDAFQLAGDIQVTIEL